MNILVKVRSFELLPRIFYMGCIALSSYIVTD